jgi:serine/threonine protein phosphatase PrpC
VTANGFASGATPAPELSEKQGTADATVVAAVTCRACGAPAGVDDRFCEACGADLPFVNEQQGAAAPRLAAPVDGDGCAACGGQVDDDGYCTVCGIKQPDRHDHEELDLGWAAGVTDRGLHHPHNEDALFLAAPRRGLAVAVVCDGVSSSSNAQAAATAATEASGRVLLGAIRGDANGALVRAAAAAQDAVVVVPKIGEGEAPSCTFVAVVLNDGELTVGWLGDSRAYWFGAGGNRRLTTDDSWAADQVAHGNLSEEEAEAAEEAHSITRWLGADAPDIVPHLVHEQLSGPGSILVCSDGLWNYASTVHQLAALLADRVQGSTPISTAQHLTEFARDAGGHDNITVVLLAADPTVDKGER